ncbi:hypothetical protein PG985_003078 [Apiospora marii]|uniref:uncharacterized protein n=1 Tax=Apiospora marii TaxID=335849 RepID=UPI0031315AE7
MAKPVCSNCQLYKVRCTTTLIRRRAMAPKLKPPADVPPPEREPRTHHAANNNESLEARLKGIEARLDSLGASSAGDASLASLLGYPPTINPHDFSSNMDMSILETPNGAEPVIGNSSSNNSSSHASPAGDSFFPELPPLHEALPVIECYFQEFNSILPLHHQPTFMRLLHRCYSGGGGVEQQQQQRQKVEFALVHSVLAIGYRLRPGVADNDTFVMGSGGAAIPNPFAEDKSQQYLQACGRLLHDLVTRDEDTLGIQALLAMVVLHLANGDEKLASMLISAAMRLAHSLQLHTSASDVSFPLHEAQQRHNIFWICYCLDKDTSLRTITPSVQLDDDIDLGLPGTTSPCVCVSPENMFGIMEEEGRPPPPFHYLRARVQLAFIQGQIYDKLYSARSLKETPEKRRQQVARLDTLLDAWRRSSLPPAPAPAVHQEGAEDNHDGLAATLNHTHLFCLFTLHGLYSQDSVWVQNIDVLGRTALEDFSNKSGRCMHSLQPPIPDAWNKCVLASRCSVELITNNNNNHEKRQNNSTNNNNIWSSTCLLFSALVILLVNITYEPGHPRAPHDRQLAADGAALFQQGLLLRRKGGDDEKSSANTLASVLRGLELAADKWTDYYVLDPLSVRPPLPAKGHDLFGNGILAMPAGASSLDLVRDDEAASTELVMVSGYRPIPNWFESNVN